MRRLPQTLLKPNFVRRRRAEERRMKWRAAGRRRKRSRSLPLIPYRGIDFRPASNNIQLLWAIDVHFNKTDSSLWGFAPGLKQETVFQLKIAHKYDYSEFTSRFTSWIRLNQTLLKHVLFQEQPDLAEHNGLSREKRSCQKPVSPPVGNQFTHPGPQPWSWSSCSRSHLSDTQSPLRAALGFEVRQHVVMMQTCTICLFLSLFPPTPPGLKLTTLKHSAVVKYSVCVTQIIGQSQKEWECWSV